MSVDPSRSARPRAAGGSLSLGTAAMPMHRAFRLRRFAVALFVVLLIAVAFRFARPA